MKGIVTNSFVVMNYLAEIGLAPTEAEGTPAFCAERSIEVAIEYDRTTETGALSIVSHRPGVVDLSELDVTDRAFTHVDLPALGGFAIASKEEIYASPREFCFLVGKVLQCAENAWKDYLLARALDGAIPSGQDARLAKAA